jgi:hypothetical protein
MMKIMHDEDNAIYMKEAVEPAKKAVTVIGFRKISLQS